jgi:hypothetical protein
MNSLNLANRHSEQGGARAKLIVFLLVFAAVIYVGYLYVPVSIDSYYFKDVMQSKVDQAAVQGFDSGWVTDQLKKSGRDYNVPDNASISTGLKEGRFEVHVQFSRPIALPGYTYNYEFDHTVKSTNFLSK